MNDNVVSPIKDATKLDLLVERNDGGIEMCIVAEAPVDGSSETLELLETKIRNYIREALDESFRKGFGNVSLDQIEIFFESRFRVDQAALSLISLIATEVEKLGIRLKYRGYR